MLTSLNAMRLWNAFGCWEEFCKSCKATQCTTQCTTHSTATPEDGPACFCEPHWGIRTFIKAMISFRQCYIYCIPGVLQVHDLSTLSLAAIPCKQFLFSAGETNSPPINSFTADWGTSSCSLDNKPACFLWPRSCNFQHNNLKLYTISYGIKSYRDNYSLLLFNIMSEVSLGVKHQQVWLLEGHYRQHSP